MWKLPIAAIVLIISCMALALTTGNSLKDINRTVSLPLNPVQYKPESFVISELRAAAAKAFTVRNKYNQQLCFFIDMSLPSGSPRFFVYDLKKDTVINAGLVTHGNCNQYWLEGRQYGNTVGCGCTSLGKYKIGKSYYGKFGLAYKLHGLDSTNDKAFERFVVLHSHGCVPDNKREQDICQSNGCPTVSPSFLNTLQARIDASEQPVLLWLYE
ncbi:MAG TPA: murein L,D-transpeptidase catalytic domain family protein [Niabella sp.]|nr:murein L,D-transpeptidase catalytic domain family protein [Niabella sp.]